MGSDGMRLAGDSRYWPNSLARVLICRVGSAQDPLQEVFRIGLLHFEPASVMGSDGIPSQAVLVIDQAGGEGR